MEQLPRQPTRIAPIDNEAARQLGVATNTRQKMQDLLQPQAAKHLGYGEPDRLDLTDKKEAVLTLILIQGHQQQTRLGCRYRSRARRRQHFAGMHRSEIGQARFHLEAILSVDVVPETDFDDPRAHSVTGSKKPPGLLDLHPGSRLQDGA